MYDKLMRGYGGIMKLVLKFILVIVFIIIVIGAGFVGYAQGFSQCFGRQACSSMDQSAFVIYPILVITGGGYLYYRWRKHQNSKYVKAIKEEALSEVGKSPLSHQEGALQAVTSLLERYDKLTMADLVAKSGLDNDAVVAAIRAMLADQTIRQIVEPDGVYLTLAR